MVDTTIHRDAERRVVLTHEQALVVARGLRYGVALDLDEWWLIVDGVVGPGKRGFNDAALREAALTDALIAYVLRWAPVVQAAQAQEEAISHMTAKPGGASVWTESDYARWQGATDATERAVRAARGEGEPPP